MALLEKVFDTLAGRMRQRTATAHERIEAAAKAIARGENVDVAGLEDSLFTVGMSLDGFRALTDLFVTRKEKLVTLEKLGPARKKTEKIDKEIEAANAAHAEACEQYRKRFVSLREQADAAQTEVDRCRNCREWLLDPANCPPSLRPEYEATLAEEEAAQEAVGNAERDVRQLEENIRSENGWLEQLSTETNAEIAPAAKIIVKSCRDRMSAARAAQYDQHQAKKTRLERRLAEAQSELDKARAALVAAAAAVTGIRKRVLAA